MSGRKLNAVEQKIHQAALAADERVRSLLLSAPHGADSYDNG
jgi:hypothetical protein